MVNQPRRKMEAPARKAIGLCSKLCKSGPQLYRNFILRHKNKSSFCAEREMRGAGDSLFAGMLALENIPHQGMQMPRNSESSCCCYLGPLSQVLQGSAGGRGAGTLPAPPAYGTWQGRITETWVSSQEDTAALKCPSRTRKKSGLSPAVCTVSTQGARLLGACQEGDPEAKFWACILLLMTLPLWDFAGHSVCSVPTHSSEEAELGQSPSCRFWFLE